jgi:predicted transcriptional regulator
MTIDQLDLFSELPFQRHSATSRAAAKEIEPLANELRARVYRCIGSCGPITDEEIAITTGLNPSTARPRRIELVAVGLVRAHHIPARTRSGRIATAWVVADKVGS